MTTKRHFLRCLMMRSNKNLSKESEERELERNEEPRDQIRLGKGPKV